MNKFKNSMAILLIFAITSSQLVSCSKDSDLLSEYVTQDNIDISSLNILADDSFAVTFNSTHILDVLANDEINADNITISSVSDPRYGEIEIRENNTLQYIALNNDSDTAAEEVVTDTVIYTTETTDITTPIETDSATVVINISLDSEEEIYAELKTVQELKIEFDEAWLIEKDRFLDISKSGDQGDLYYLEGIEALITIFQATGEINYMTEALSICKNIINTSAKSSILKQINGKYNDEFLSWEDGPNGITDGIRQNDYSQYSLSEGRGFRHIAKLLWILKKNPTIRENDEIQRDYDILLSFLIDNVWNKWQSRGLHHFYRATVDPTANWAHIGLMLYKITDNAHYKLVFDRFNTDMTSGGRTSSMSENIRPNSKNPKAYMWYRQWDESSLGIEDHSHGNRAVSLIVDAYELNEYWTLEDLKALKKTVDVFWPEGTDGSSMHEFIDGTIGDDNRPRLETGWSKLGRIDANFQLRMQKRDLKQSENANTLSLNAAIMAYNKAYLDDNLIY